MEFQADVGVLEYHQFRPGDLVFGISRQMNRSPISPAPGLEEADFWAYGIGACPNCKHELWAKIDIRSGRFDSLALVPRPADPDAWDKLPDERRPALP
jgi:hypothetical protein